MNKSDVLALVNSHYPDPVFTPWTPSEYMMKYTFNTPRRMKKLPVVEAKENAKLREVYDAEVAKKNSVLFLIDKIDQYPVEVAALFFGTFGHTIKYIENCHQIYKDMLKKLNSYDSGSRIAESLKYHLTQTTYDPYSRRRKTCMVVLDDEAWKKFAESYRGEFLKDSSGEYHHDKPALRIEDPKKFMQLVIDYYNAYDNDDIAKYGKEAYVIAIKNMAGSLERIVESIEQAFDGNVPTRCLTDASWGNKGEFCGILTDGVKKLSFKSFGAGGYNIQRYHFRFKITELKH